MPGTRCDDDLFGRDSPRAGYSGVWNVDPHPRRPYRLGDLQQMDPGEFWTQPSRPPIDVDPHQVAGGQASQRGAGVMREEVVV